MLSALAAASAINALSTPDPYRADACCPLHAMIPAYEPAEDASKGSPVFAGWPDSAPVQADLRESSLGALKQLTFGGQNAEAYWDISGSRLVWQSRQPQFPDEQIFSMNADGSGKRLISTGLGRTTCSYFAPDMSGIFFSSTHAKDPGPQKPIDMSKGYVWMVNPNFSLWRSKLDGSGLEQVISKRGYVAETTIAPDGSYMTFTGSFEGDLDIYRSKLDGTGLKRLTDEYGYDGGPFVSWDGKKIVYRRSPDFASRAEREQYKELLKQNLVRPSRMDLWIMNADGTGKRQVTREKGASFAPFLHPNGRQIIFCSNMHDPKGREFDLFVVNVDGSGLRQVTFSPDFDGFPMFSKDGKKLVWSSNRNGKVRGETNVFVADWKG